MCVNVFVCLLLSSITRTLVYKLLLATAAIGTLALIHLYTCTQGSLFSLSCHKVTFTLSWYLLNGTWIERLLLHHSHANTSLSCLPMQGPMFDASFIMFDCCCLIVNAWCHLPFASRNLPFVSWPVQQALQDIPGLLINRMMWLTMEMRWKGKYKWSTKSNGYSWDAPQWLAKPFIQVHS